MKEVKQLEETSRAKKGLGRTDRNIASGAKTVTIPFAWLYASAILFLTIPLLMFFIGYLRFAVGIPLTLAFLAILFYAISDCLNDPNGVKLSDKSKEIKIPLSYLIGCAVTALLISFVTGVGEYIYTLQDHQYRRAILRDLVNYDWPVIYNYSTQQNPEVREIFGIASGERAFSYYFIYWMPAALAGKIFGFEFGNFVLLLWNSLGIFLCFLVSSAAIKKYSPWVPFMFVFFSGLDAIPNIVHLFTQYSSWKWFEGFVPVMTYVSNFRELACVFNQMVPSFLVVGLLLLSNNTRSMGLTAGILFAYSPWAVFGIIPIVAAVLFGKKLRAETMSKMLFNIFSPSNITSAVLLLVVLGSYYGANSSATGVRGFAWTYFDNPFLFVLAYLVFVAVEVLPFAVILYKNKKDDVLFWVALITLLVIPFYKITDMNDFSMRGSMPALFLLCIYMSDIVSEVMNEKNTPTTKKGWVKSAAIMLTVILMMIPALFNGFIIFGSEITGDPGDKEDIGSFGNINKAEYAEVIQEQFFTEDYKNCFFYKYFAKKT